MMWERRVGSGVLAGLSILLACLMVYVLIIENLAELWTVDARKLDAVDVSVFFVERSEWRIFLEALNAALLPPRNLGRIVAEEDRVVVVETEPHGHRVRFNWVDVRGEGETGAEVRRLARNAQPPLAIIGSSNTVLTSALADALSIEKASRPLQAPVLLVPWATSLSLLKAYPGRTFRFCSNNRRAAGLLVDGMFARSGSPPSRVVIVVDARDPYSVDLARCFREAVERVAPTAEITERADVLSPTLRRYSPGGMATPTEAEQEFARSIWSDAFQNSDSRTWLFLPIQNEPIRRIFAALNGAAPSRQMARHDALTVACGDSVGLTTFSTLVNALAFPVWGLSGVSNLGSEPIRSLGDDVQVLAEIATVILEAIGKIETLSASALHEGILHFNLPRTDHRALGRSIAFLPSGERAWESDEDLLYLFPGKSRPCFVTRDATGVWSAPVSLDPADSARTP